MCLWISTVLMLFWKDQRASVWNTVYLLSGAFLRGFRLIHEKLIGSADFVFRLWLF